MSPKFTSRPEPRGDRATGAVLGQDVRTPPWTRSTSRDRGPAAPPRPAPRRPALAFLPAPLCPVLSPRPAPAPVVTRPAPLCAPLPSTRPAPSPPCQGSGWAGSCGPRRGAYALTPRADAILRRGRWGPPPTAPRRPAGTRRRSSLRIDYTGTQSKISRVLSKCPAICV